MNKGRVISLLKQHGDVILTHKQPEQTKVFHRGEITNHLCTLDFKNKYIKANTRGKKPWPKNKTDIVVFNWSTNNYWILNPINIIKAQALAEVLQNVRDDSIS